MSWSGSPRRIVEIASAWISGPLISSAPEVEVAATSCSDGATAPTTTILSRNAEAGTRPRSTRENEYCVSVPGGPWKSIQASPPSNAGTGRLRRELGPDDAEPEQAVDLVRHPPDDAVGIRGHDRVARPGADLEQ